MVKTFSAVLFFVFALGLNLQAADAVKSKKLTAPKGLTSKSATKSSTGQSRVSGQTVVPASEKAVRISSKVELTSGTIASSDVSNFFPGVTPGAISQAQGFRTLTPEVRADLKNSVSVYGQVPVSWSASDDGSTYRQMGRPALGALKSVALNNNLRVGAGLTTRLPIFDSSIGNSEAMHSWEVAPGAVADGRLGAFVHYLGKAELAYNTATDFSLNGQTQTWYRPLEVRTTAGLERSIDEALSVGVAVYTINSLGNGRAAGVQYSPLDLSRGEITASYTATPTTKFTAALSKGFKTSSSPYAFVNFDNAVAISDNALSVGVLQNF